MNDIYIGIEDIIKEENEDNDIILNRIYDILKKE